MAVVRRADRPGEWWVDFRFQRRRVRRRAPGNGKRDAERYEHALRAQMTKDLELGKDPFMGPAPRLDEFAPRWMTNYVRPNNRPSTISDKESILRNHLIPALGSSRLDEITTARIDSLIASLVKSGLKPKTINNILSTLRCCLNVAVEWGELRFVPKFRWQRTPERSFRFFEPEEAERLIAAADVGFWRTFILFLLHTGCRFGEAAALRWQNVHLDDLPYVHIKEAASRGVIQATKTGNVHDVPLTTRLAEALRELPRRSDRVFPRPDGGIMQPGSKNKYIRKFLRRAGLSPAGFHAARHTYATTLLMRGANIRAVQDLLAHSNIKMTARYAHVTQSSLRQTVGLLEQEPETEQEMSSGKTTSQPRWTPAGHQAPQQPHSVAPSTNDLISTNAKTDLSVGLSPGAGNGSRSRCLGSIEQD